MKVLFAPAAKLDLLSIGEHIEQENPTRAISFVDDITIVATRLPICRVDIRSCRAMNTGASGVACTEII